MALHFEYSKVKGPRVDPNDEEKIHPMLHRLIWGCLAVDMMEITEKNWEEFYWRLHLWELVTKASDKTTPKDVHDYIGLNTNVSNKTRLQFLKKIGSVQDDNVYYIMKAFKKEQEKSAEKEEAVDVTSEG